MICCDIYSKAQRDACTKHAWRNSESQQWWSVSFMFLIDRWKLMPIQRFQSPLKDGSCPALHDIAQRIHRLYCKLSTQEWYWAFGTMHRMHCPRLQRAWTVNKTQELQKKQTFITMFIGGIMPRTMSRPAHSKTNVLNAKQAKCFQGSQASSWHETETSVGLF